jgi:hypothetical protein
VNGYKPHAENLRRAQGWTLPSERQSRTIQPRRIWGDAFRRESQNRDHQNLAPKHGLGEGSLRPHGKRWASQFPEWLRRNAGNMAKALGERRYRRRRRSQGSPHRKRSRLSEQLLRHRRSMGSSIWEYLWLPAHVSFKSDAGLAIVDGGKPITTGRIAAD